MQQTVMISKERASSYIVDNSSAKFSEPNFSLKETLYEQYKQSKRNGYKGTFEEYLTVRDYT